MSNIKERITHVALISTTVLLGMLVLSYFMKSLATASLICSIAVILFEILVPIETLKFYGINPKSFNIYAHNIDTIFDLLFPPWGQRKIRPDFSSITKEFIVFFKTSLLIFIPYIISYWIFFKFLAATNNLHLIISLNFPPQIIYEIIIQIFVVALPEELFYRGFLQSALIKRWPTHTKILGLPMGRAIIITNVIFALGHVAASFTPLRMLTFFPGLIFSFLVYKNHSLLSAILFHAACNILGQILSASFFLV
jgi:membrane protease YdiL (CAAX protease family)